MSAAGGLIKRLLSCPAGTAGWKEFEEVCTEIFIYLFVPPLTLPARQARSYSGIDRRDAVFPNRNFDSSNNWGRLYIELRARMILVEFKNYDSADIGKDEINQTRNYLTPPLGKLAFVCGTKPPNEAAHVKRNSIYGEDGKVILFLTVDDLSEMVIMKERGEDPSNFIMDPLEKFYLQYE